MAMKNTTQPPFNWKWTCSYETNWKIYSAEIGEDMYINVVLGLYAHGAIGSSRIPQLTFSNVSHRFVTVENSIG